MNDLTGLAVYLRDLCNTIDSNKRIKTDSRKKRRLVDEWNEHMINICDKEKGSDYALMKGLYNFITQDTLKYLTWDETKIYIFEVTVIINSISQIRGGSHDD